MAEHFNNIVFLMTVSVISVWCFRRLNLPPILAYLFSGIIAGPGVLALFSNPDDMHFFAELGVVFLLFSLGLEFSLPKMLAMRYLVFGVGLSQTLLTTLCFMLLALLLQFDAKTAFVIGAMAAVSSTAIVIKQSAEMGILNNSRSQMSVSILLFQDLAVVPFLIVIPLLASGGGEQAMWLAILMAVLKGGLVLFILMSVGKWLLPKIFSEVALTRTDELFVLTTILVTLIAAGLTHSFGLSMALGAFLAGMMLGESQYRHQLEADIRPFRDILMGLFFVTVGMRLDLNMLVMQVHWVLLGLAILLSVKFFVIYWSAVLFKAEKSDALATGFKLCQMGEFGFVIAALAANHGLLSAEQTSLFMSIGVLSMAVTPWLISRSHQLSSYFAKDTLPEVSPEQDSYAELEDHVLIFGYGRVGQSVSRLLKVEAIPYVAVDADPIRVHESRSAGEPVYFGDVKQKDILRAVGIDKAKLAILSFDEHSKAVGVIQTVVDLNPELPIVVRTRDDKHLQDLYLAGASQVVPEILEGSLMLVSQVLHLSGVPMSRILKRVRKERKSQYGHLHGFFPGENTDLTYGKQEKLEFMHAVILGADAFAVGKKLAEIELERLRVELKGLRRDNKEIAEPDGDMMLNANDVLIITGKPRRVERAERFLLEGD